MHKTLIIIPARYGSKGLKDKNILKIKNKHLVEFPILTAKKFSFPKEIYVTTDDDRVIKIAKKNNLKVYFKRPKNISGDKTPTSEVVIHSLNFFKKKNNYYPKYFILLQPTTPFRSAPEISKNFYNFIKSKKKTLLSVCDAIHHPSEYITINSNKLKYVMNKNNAKRRQDFKSIYFENGSVYAGHTKYFLKTKRFVNETSYIYKQSYETSIDIDTKEDLEFANYYYGKYKNKKQLF